jgi:hypothetical protein
MLFFSLCNVKCDSFLICIGDVWSHIIVMSYTGTARLFSFSITTSGPYYRGVLLESITTSGTYIGVYGRSITTSAIVFFRTKKRCDAILR